MSSSSASSTPPPDYSFRGRRRYLTSVPPGAYVLSLGTVAALTSAACLVVAFATDNWAHLSVDREAVRRSAVDGVNVSLALDTDHRYFDRVQGMFRECFPHDERPPTSSLYLSWLEEWCRDIDFRIKLLHLVVEPQRATHYGIVWFHVARSSLAAFVLYFMIMGIGCVTGLIGCWKHSGEQLVSTAVLFMLASLSAAGGMGLWHWAHFYEQEKVHDERMDFRRSWPDELQTATSFTLGWSYIVAWLGIALGFLASALFSVSAVCIRHDERDREHCEMLHSIQQSYPTLTNVIMRQPNGTNSSMPGTLTTGVMSRRGSLTSSTFYPNGGGAVGGDLNYFSYSLGGSQQNLAQQGSYYHRQQHHTYHNENLENSNRTLKYKNVVNELKDAKL